MITGNNLIEWGFAPGKHFPGMIESANVWRGKGMTDEEIIVGLQSHVPVTVHYQDTRIPVADYLELDDPSSLAETANINAVRQTMSDLVRIPTVRAASLMPDACVAGTIPVGGVVATENALHPGYHSADICCSMALTMFHRNDDPKTVLDVAQQVTHFGPLKKGGQQRYGMEPSAKLMKRMQENPFLKDLINPAISAFMTQGDGNHFLFVGHMESTGKLAIVTHHGSRVLGALLYKRGMAAAKRHTRIVAPRIPAEHAWLDTTREEGKQYWEALQLVREWTRENHFAIHTMISRTLGNSIADRFWNEHNFIFKQDDGLFYHAKGATPVYRGFSEDDVGLSLIPMNMEEPILITSPHPHAPKEALGFAPHGAGRNMSRTSFLRLGEPALPRGVDHRFFCGLPDPSEYPSAYKRAEHVTRIIRERNLAQIVERIIPYGSIMAGDWEANAPWRKPKVAV